MINFDITPFEIEGFIILSISTFVNTSSFWIHYLHIETNKFYFLETGRRWMEAPHKIEMPVMISNIRLTNKSNDLLYLHPLLRD